MAKKKTDKILKDGMTKKEWEKFNKERRLPPIPPSRMSDTKRGKLIKLERIAKQNKKDQDY